MNDIKTSQLTSELQTLENFARANDMKGILNAIDRIRKANSIVDSMSIEGIRKTVSEIAHYANTGDFEIAHGKEDDLYESFVDHVAMIGDCVGRSHTEVLVELQRLANEVLTTRNISFQRI
jgi:hypothetical protein